MKKLKTQETKPIINWTIILRTNYFKILPLEAKLKRKTKIKSQINASKVKNRESLKRGNNIKFKQIWKIVKLTSLQVKY